MSEDYFKKAQDTGLKLDKVSSTMCMAKWLQVSMHLPQGLTQSCYHPPTHKVPLNELAESPRALHNTQEKMLQRKQMKEGERPGGCHYCWNIEDAPDGPHLSDRQYRSSEWWVDDAWDEVVESGLGENINPRYVEVNFNQACNFKCTYCSPHLSTEWEKEVREHGALVLHDGKSHNNLKSLRDNGLMPLVGPTKENPYVEAFWEWWPDLYPDLKVFRMTGGEPLMDKNTFKVLSYVNKNPKGDLDLSITSNMCPPNPKLFDKFLSQLKAIEEIRVWEDPDKINPETNNNWYVAPAAKHFSLFVSVDSVGEQAEYIRTGLDYDVMLNNVRTVLQETHGTEVSFINTFSLLSIPGLKDFLQMILDLRVEFGYENQQEVRIKPPDHNGFEHPEFVRKRRQRVWFDIPFLQFPDWMSAQNAHNYPDLIAMLDEAIEFMEENKEDANYGRTYHGFKEYEIAKMRRNRAWISAGSTSVTEEDMALRKANFWKYFNQINRRRGVDFAKTFPELGGWWNDCRVEHEKKERNTP